MILKDQFYGDRLRFKYDNEKRYEDCLPNDNYAKELLFNAVRINEYLSPQIYSVISALKNKIGQNYEINVYVKSNPNINAYSYSGFENDINILLTSALVNIMTIDEIKFVIAHECAHVIFNHHRPFIGGLIEEAKRFLANTCEISCDRFAHVMVDNPLSSFSALLKMESGLNQDKLNLNVREYLKDFKNLNESDLIYSSNYSSHPFVNTRIRALLLFETSNLYYDIKQYKEVPPSDISRVDQKIVDDIIKNGFIRFDLIEKDYQEKLVFWQDLLSLVEQNKSKEHFVHLYGLDKYEMGIRTYKSEGKIGVIKRIDEKKEALNLAVYLI